MKNIKNEKYCYVVVGKIEDFQNNENLPFFVKKELQNTTSSKVINQRRAAYGLLHHALLKFLNYNDDFLEIKKSDNGKPLSENYYFSISHSDELVAITISSDNVGIDIECVDRNFDIEKIKKTMLHPNEKKLKLSTKKDCIRLWVQKEAKFKFDGAKIFYPSNIDTTTTSSTLRFLKFNNKSYYVCVATNQNNFVFEAKL